MLGPPANNRVIHIVEGVIELQIFRSNEHPGKCAGLLTKICFR